MRLAADHPIVLLLLIFCIPKLLGSGARWRPVSSVMNWPADRLSRAVDGALRLLSAAAVALLVLGLAGLHQEESTVWRTGTGAHVVLVLDRSLSMDEPFARMGEMARETKTAAASRLIEALFERRPHDQFGMVAFSTQPIPVMPLTGHRDAVRAALAAMRQKALANTEIGGGLASGLAMLTQDHAQAAHVLLFVSDGAGTIPDDTQDYLREAALRAHAHIYYIYLRAGDDPPLEEDLTGRNDSTRPASLDLFFRSLGVPYRGMEARNADAVDGALRLIDRLETRPEIYAEAVPRRDLRKLCFAAAAFCLGLLLLARLAERDFTGVARS